jgi:hypothetical protein
MLNKDKDNWVFRNAPNFEFPEPGREVVMLVEHDVVYDKNENFPFIEFGEVLVTELPDGKRYSWKLTKYDPETQEEILQQCYTVMAWRYF